MIRTTTSVMGALVVIILIGSVGTVGAAHTTSHDVTVTATGTETAPAMQSSPVAAQSASSPAVGDAVTASSDVVRDVDEILPDVQDLRYEFTDGEVTASLLALVPPAAYSRHDSSDPLAQGTRQSIYETVTDRPGIYVSDIAAATDVPASTVRYHVRILAFEDVIETDRIRGKRRIFPVGSERNEVTTALSDDSTAPLLHALRREEPVGVSDLAESVGLASSTVSYHLSRLEEADLVERNRDGMSVSVSLTPVARHEIPE